jgi:hypothetical protein
VKEHLEALSEVTSRGADFEAFLEFMKVCTAHWEALWKQYTKTRWARLHMHLHRGKQRAFDKFFNELRALKEDKRKMLVLAYGSGRWASTKGCIPAPSTRAYKDCAHRFVSILMNAFGTSSIHHELGCTLQRVEMEKCQRSPGDIQKYGAVTEGQEMESRAQVRGLPALVSTSGDEKRLECVNRDFSASINIKSYAVLEKRLLELTRDNFVVSLSR